MSVATRPTQVSPSAGRLPHHNSCSDARRWRSWCLASSCVYQSSPTPRCCHAYCVRNRGVIYGLATLATRCFGVLIPHGRISLKNGVGTHVFSSEANAGDAPTPATWRICFAMLACNANSYPRLAVQAHPCMALRILSLLPLVTSLWKSFYYHRVLEVTVHRLLLSRRASLKFEGGVHSLLCQALCEIHNRCAMILMTISQAHLTSRVMWCVASCCVFVQTTMAVTDDIRAESERRTS
jgi:hypothetical protein